MIKKILFLFTMLICSGHLMAQEGIPFDFTSEEDNRLIKENDSVKFYVASTDTTNIVSINEEALTYRLLNKSRKLIADGSFVMEGDKFLQDGKWTERFENGKIKRAGYYLRGKPVGTWEEFYDSGKPKIIANYAILKDDLGNVTSCLSGSYHEYYKNGLLKSEGLYAAVLVNGTDVIEVTDPITGAKTETKQKTTTFKAEKTGHWDNYDESGDGEKSASEKKEDKD